MGYRIRMAPEVAGWLGQLRDTDPGTAGVVDEALTALRDQGASLGPPLVIPVEVRPEPARLDLDQAYQRQLEMLARVRRAVAEMATARKRLELQIHQQEQAVTRLGEQRIKDLHGRPARRRDRTRLAGRLVYPGDTPIPDPVRAGPERYRLTSRSA